MSPSAATTSRLAGAPALHRVAAATLLAAGLANAPSAVSQVPEVTVSGNVELIPPPPSVVQGDLESLDTLFLFREQAEVTLTTPLKVDIDAPGTYTFDALPPLGSIPAGARIASFYGHFDTLDTREWRRAAGELTFSQPILGIATNEDTLNSSDFLGAPLTIYTIARATDFYDSGKPDAMTVSSDRRTVSLDVQTLPATDNFRIFVGDPIIHAPVGPGVTATLRDIGLRPVPTAWGLAKEAAGTLVLDQEMPFAGPTRIIAGTLVVTGPASLGQSDVSVADDARLIFTGGDARPVASLALAASSLVDIGTSSVTVAKGLTPEQALAAVRLGLGDGTWNGLTGITSSAVAADLAANTARSVGWRADADGSVTFAYTAPGDTNLDGQVNIFDFVDVRSAGQFGAGSTSVWSQGDFDYNGVTNVFDLVLANGAGVYGAGGYRPDPAAAPAVTAVPEPGLAVITMAALALACQARLRGSRPRRRSRGMCLLINGRRTRPAAEV